MDFFTRFLYLIEEVNTQETHNRSWSPASKWSVASSQLNDIQDVKVASMWIENKK